MNHTHLPKEVLLPDWARRGKQSTKGDHVKLGKALLIPFRDMYCLHFQDSRTGLPYLLQPKWEPFAINVYFFKILTMHVRKSSSNMLLNAIYAQTNLSVEPTFCKSRKSQDTNMVPAHIWTNEYINTFAASYLNTQGLNNSCLKSPASTLFDLIFQSRALRSFSLNQLRNLSL